MDRQLLTIAQPSTGCPASNNLEKDEILPLHPLELGGILQYKICRPNVHPMPEGRQPRLNRRIAFFFLGSFNQF